MRVALVTALAFTYGLGLAWYFPATPEPAKRYLIEVITIDGNAYVAGSGDDCTAAWQHAVMPDDWQEIACRAAD